MDKTLKDLENIEHSDLVGLYLDKQAECNKLKEQLSAFRITTTHANLKYDTNWSWMQKIVFALTKLDKPALSSEIISELEKHDDHFDFYNDKEKIFSSYMTRASIYGVIIKNKIGGFKGSHYALPQWCDDEDNLLKFYRDKISVL